MLDLHVPLVLASQSPRRRQLLERLGLTFTVQPSGAEEVLPEGAGPAEAVEVLARQKAEAVAPDHPDALTLGADTLVVLEDDVLGKPADADEAAAMLTRLAGRTHTVYTGIALLHPPSRRSVTAHEATAVTFAPLDAHEVAAYVATGSPMDKAGAYGIQDDLGALFVAGIEGDYYNVVGLPLHRLYRTLRSGFADLLPPRT
ncbi:MAG: Maf family protein [Rhodothermales bacterium]|nr:Maf family protein [Rhodothermales bacterium]